MPSPAVRPSRLGFSLLCAALAACSTTPPPAKTPTPAATPAPAPPEKPEVRTLTLIHSSDHESRLVSEDGQTGSLERFVSITRALEAKAGDTAFVAAAGDTILPAPLLRLQLDKIPAAVGGNNLIGLRASAIGNHEFDLGESFFASVVKQAAFPFLSATLTLDGGPLDALDAEADELGVKTPWLSESAGRILPRARACVGGTITKDICSGTTIGVVGATVDTLRSITHISRGVKPAIGISAMRDAIQTQVDALEQQGIDIIVLLSHMQGLHREIALVDAGLTGVDIVVGGGGDNRLANPDQPLHPGETPDPICEAIAARSDGKESCFPIVMTDAVGKKVLVTSTEGQYRYIGQVVANFDRAGDVIDYDAARTRPYPVTDEVAKALGATGDPKVAAYMKRVREMLEPLSKVIADSPVFLNGIREAVRNRETNLGDLGADAMTWAAREYAAKGAPEVAFGLRNGGGIRASIGSTDAKTGARTGGPITELDLRTAFSFNNDLVVVTTTHQAVVDTFEATLRGAGGSRGRFPQVSGQVVLRYDPKGKEAKLEMAGDKVVGIEKAGERVRDLTIGGQTLVKDGKIANPEAEITLVTLSYLAGGGDGYFPGHAENLKKTYVKDSASQPVNEQRCLAEYLKNLADDPGWKKGERYRDPDPATPESHPRLRKVE